VRKFILNTSVLSAVASGWGVVQTTRHGPRDWRLVLMYVSWGISLAIAVGTVIEESKAEQNELER
jgi:uncharacterized membrane protein YraQ (UPF0718 family)